MPFKVFLYPFKKSWRDILLQSYSPSSVGKAGRVLSLPFTPVRSLIVSPEYATRNIRVNCSQLGYARTPMVEKMAVDSNPENPEQAIQDIAVNVPIKRLAKPTEVGELFAFLGSDEASYITGEQIVIDGAAT